MDSGYIKHINNSSSNLYPVLEVYFIDCSRFQLLIVSINHGHINKHIIVGLS